MSLLGFEHVGTTTADLDHAIGFYRDLLGLRLVLRKAQTSGEVAFLDAGGGMLEIAAPAGPIGVSLDVLPDNAGLRHVTLAFTEIDTLVARLEAAGVEIIERPRLAYNSEMLHRVAFCRDPDGIIVELAERAVSRL